MKCIEYQIRMRVLNSGLFNAVAAVQTHGRTGTTLTEILIECCSGPCTTESLALRRAEQRTQAYLANRFAHPSPSPTPALQWSPRWQPARQLDLQMTSAS